MVIAERAITADTSTGPTSWVHSNIVIQILSVLEAAYLLDVSLADLLELLGLYPFGALSCNLRGQFTQLRLRWSQHVARTTALESLQIDAVQSNQSMMTERMLQGPTGCIVGHHSSTKAELPVVKINSNQER